MGAVNAYGVCRYQDLKWSFSTYGVGYTVDFVFPGFARTSYDRIG